MEFYYKAKKSLDETVEGKISAESLEQAIEQLEKQGIVPITVEPSDKEKTVKKESVDLSSGNFSFKRVTLFTRKLYNLIKSHVELLSALKLLESQSNDSVERLLLEDIIKNVKQGMTFSQALARHPRFFSPLYINLVRTGESTGQLRDSFAQLLNHMQRIEELRMKIRQAIAYPIFMIVVGIGTVFVMLTFILPRLAAMFEDFQAELPLPTRVLLGASDVFKKYWLVMIILSGALVLFLRKKYQKKGGVFSLIKFRLPIVKGLVYKQTIANFSTSVSLLLKSGVSLLSALGIAAPIIANPEYIAQMQEVRKDIEKGASFSRALAKFKIFPVFFVQMIRVGEESGRLDTVLADIADSYEQEIESDLKIISTLIEPSIILVLGLLIGGMVIAVLLPIFNINALVGS